MSGTWSERSKAVQIIAGIIWAVIALFVIGVLIQGYFVAMAVWVFVGVPVSIGLLMGVARSERVRMWLARKLSWLNRVPIGIHLERAKTASLVVGVGLLLPSTLFSLGMWRTSGTPTGTPYDNLTYALVLPMIAIGGVMCLIPIRFVWQKTLGRPSSVSVRSLPGADTSKLPNAQIAAKTAEQLYFEKLDARQRIYELDPIAFERFVASLFAAMGYQVETTKLSGDEGVDLVLHKDGKMSIVQCKRYDGSVGQPVVRDLYGSLIHNRAEDAYLVTTGTITLPAQQWAKGKPIHLIDGSMLVEWKRQFADDAAPINAI